MLTIILLVSLIPDPWVNNVLIFLCVKRTSLDKPFHWQEENLGAEQQHFHKSSFFTGIDNGQNVTCTFAHFSIMNKVSLSLQEKQHRVSGN